MIEKSQQRIFDNPTPEQVKAVLEKAKKKTQEKKKGSPAASPKKKDIVLEKIESLVKRQDRLEGIVTAVGAPSSEKKASDQEKQAIKTNQEILAEVQGEQDKATGQEEPGQTKGQLTQEQYQALSPEKKVPILEAQLQQLQGGQFQGEPQNPGKLTGREGLYGLVEVIKAAAPVVQTAVAKGGSNSDSPLKVFLSQLSTYESIEKGVMDRFFNWMKMLSPVQKEATISHIATSEPRNVEIPKTDEGHIK